MRTCRLQVPYCCTCVHLIVAFYANIGRTTRKYYSRVLRSAATYNDVLWLQNQQHSTQLSSSPEEDRAIDLQMAQSFESDAFKSSSESRMDDALLTLQRRFRIHFISLIGLLFNESGCATAPFHFL